MRTLTKLLIGVLAWPGLIIGFAYEFIIESFHAGQSWYARAMENLIDWVEKK
jgi:hypothetical protein